MKDLKKDLVFQFQYGTIESLEIPDYKKYLDVSIPVWYDWKIKSQAYNKNCTPFQFQYGTIESLM